MLYKNTKVKFCSSDGDTDYFEIVAGVMHGATLAPYLFIICLEYVLRTSVNFMKENGFKLAKQRSRRYPTQTITDVDYADGIELLANTPDQAKSLLQSGTGSRSQQRPPYQRSKKEYKYFNQRRDISTLKSGSLKLEDKFTNQGNSVLSTENYINTRLAKACIAIDWQLVIWKLDKSDEIKRSFLPSSGCINTAIWIHPLDAK